ncbi:MAG: LysR family transcriptional regulator [Treponema sp.]|nr:LysR family transcriptional regulator [Treponema sp.]
MFELHQLEQFIAVAKYGTVSKAAEKLNITQPALSRSLQNLEYELRTPLFIRTKNKIALTKTGEYAADHAERLLGQADSMLLQIQEFYRVNSKLIIASCAPCEILFTLKDMIKDVFSNIECEAIIEDEDEICQKLSEGIYSMALFSKEHPNKEYFQIPLQAEKLFAMIPVNHPLAEKKEGITFSQIDGEAVIPFPLKGHWNDLLKEKLPNSQLLYQSSIESFDKVIHASNLISFESNILPIELENHIRIPILDSEAEITYHFAILKSSREYFQHLISRINNEKDIFCKPRGKPMKPSSSQKFFKE